MTNVMHKFFSMYLFVFITLHMFRAHRAHHQERQIVSIQPLVTVILCWWPRCVQVRRSLLLTCTHLGNQHRVTVTRGCIDTICLSWWWARCARNMWRVINTNKYIEKNLCITLVIYKVPRINLGLPFLSLFLVCHPAASYNPAAIHSYNTPSHANLRTLVAVTIPGYLNLLINFLSRNHFHTLAHTFFSRFSFPLSPSTFPFYSLGSVIRRHRSPLAYSLLAIPVRIGR